ncbi:hypothetical protein P73_4776 (plasmid) [Celeribacter indicus]|uniref:Uncharacterized protein n=1 Tax=Celeribacter indicus TaxID=1208324 RepID=A0A0B5E922_9RHOB|nr:hypothetical protein P73_4776 [Celeribacter indicus]
MAPKRDHAFPVIIHQITILDIQMNGCVFIEVANCARGKCGSKAQVGLPRFFLVRQGLAQALQRDRLHPCRMAHIDDHMSP